MPDTNLTPTPADPAEIELGLAAMLAPQGWTHAADGLTAPTGLTVTVRRTAHNGITVIAQGETPERPLWWIHQTHGSRMPAALIEAVLQAAGSESAAAATFETMDQAIGEGGAGWSKTTSPCTGLEGATLTEWTSPGGLRSVSASDLEGQDVSGYMTGWFVHRTPVNRRTSRTWRTSSTVPEAVLCALALTTVPKCRITPGMLETLSDLELSPSSQAGNRMIVGVRRTDSALSRTIGTIEPDSDRWAVRVLTPSGHEQRVTGSSCCVQGAMIAAWDHRQV